MTLSTFLHLAAFGSFFMLPGLASGQVWSNTTSPNACWAAIASAADGTRLVATVGNDCTGPIYISTNSGVNWTLTSAPVTGWGSVASSADGQKLVAVVANVGTIYTSTNGVARRVKPLSFTVFKTEENPAQD